MDHDSPLPRFRERPVRVKNEPVRPPDHDSIEAQMRRIIRFIVALALVVGVPVLVWLAINQVVGMFFFGGPPIR